MLDPMRVVGGGRMGGRCGVVAALMAALLGYTSAAPAATVNSCLARKLSGVGRSVSRRVFCYAHDVVRPDATARSGCLARAQTSFAGDARRKGAFVKLEALWSCVTVGDGARMDAAIGNYVAALDHQIGNHGTPSRCDAAKTCIELY